MPLFSVRLFACVERTTRNGNTRTSLPDHTHTPPPRVCSGFPQKEALRQHRLSRGWRLRRPSPTGGTPLPPGRNASCTGCLASACSGGLRGCGGMDWSTGGAGRTRWVLPSGGVLFCLSRNGSIRPKLEPIYPAVQADLLLYSCNHKMGRSLVTRFPARK